MNLELLIYDARHGNSSAQKALFDKLYNRSLLLCIRYIKNAHDAEERMMDGFYKFFRSLPTFKYESDDAFYAFINRIMVNECIMQLEKTRVFNIISEPSETDAILEDDSLEKISTEEIHEMVRKLPAGARTIFNLNVIDGWSHEEIAKILKITASTSRTQVLRAKVILQKSILIKDRYGKQFSK